MSHYLLDVEDPPGVLHDVRASSDVTSSPDPSENGLMRGVSMVASDCGSVLSMTQLQDVLSPSAFCQLTRLQNLDLRRVDYHFLEVEFADALRELEHVESVTAALFRAVLEMKRSQAVLDDRIVQLEEEIVSLQTEIKSLAGPARVSYKDAEGALRKERRDLADFKVHIAERMDNMQSSLGKTERNVTVLQLQWTMQQSTVDDLVKKLFPTQDLAQFLAAQYSEMKAREDVIWSIMKQVREEVHELTRSPFGEEALCDDITSVSLAAELQDAECDVLCRSVPPPLVVDDDGWYRSDLEAMPPPSPTRVDKWDRSVSAVLPPTVAHFDNKDIDTLDRSTRSLSSGLDAVSPPTPASSNEQRGADVSHLPALDPSKNWDAIVPPHGCARFDEVGTGSAHPPVTPSLDGQEMFVAVALPRTPAHSEEDKDDVVVHHRASTRSDDVEVTLLHAPAHSNDSKDAKMPDAVVLLQTPVDCEEDKDIAIVRHPASTCSGRVEVTPLSVLAHPVEQRDVEMMHSPTPDPFGGPEVNVDVVNEALTRPDGVSAILWSAPVCPKDAPACSHGVEVMRPKVVKMASLPTPGGFEANDATVCPPVSSPSDGYSTVLPLTPTSPDEQKGAETTPLPPTNHGSEKSPTALTHPFIPTRSSEGSNMDTVAPRALASSHVDATRLLTRPSDNIHQPAFAQSQHVDAARVYKYLDVIFLDVSPSVWMCWLAVAGSVLLVAYFVWRVAVGRPPPPSQYPMWEWASSKA